MPRKSNEIKPGFKFRGWDRDPWYVVTLFEDNGESFVVVKSWAKHKKYWVYDVKTISALQDWLGSSTRKSVEKDPSNG